MSKKPELIRSMQLPPITLQRQERYLPSAFDDSLSILEKVNKVIHSLYEYSEITNEMLFKWNEVYDWVMNEGLAQAVNDKLDEWLADGTFEGLINKLIGLVGDVKIFREFDPTVMQKMSNEFHEHWMNIKWLGGKSGKSNVNSSVISQANKLKMPLFLPEGDWYTDVMPTIRVFGFGKLYVKGEQIPIDNINPQFVDVGGYSTEPQEYGERYMNFILGQDAGMKMTSDTRANTGVGMWVFKDGKAVVRSTAVGKMSQMNTIGGYSNDSFGADALGQGEFMSRNTAMGANALKWAGNLDAIQTKHDYWLNQGSGNFIRSSGFEAKYPSIWKNLLGSDVKPSSALYARNNEEVEANVAVGRNALLHLFKGIGNTAIGYNSQSHVTVGEHNTSLGIRALRDSFEGNRNTAIGANTMISNMTGENNVGLGAYALQQSAHASHNTAIGYGAMRFFEDSLNDGDTRDQGRRNTAIGVQAMNNAKNANFSVFVGSYAGQYVEGDNNVGIGPASHPALTTGSQNAGLGAYANRLVETGSNNTSLGYSSGPDADYSNTTSLGAYSHARGNDYVMLGADNDTVYSYKAIQTVSDKREKKDIKETKFGLDFINRLNPVDFIYKNSVNDRVHHGVIAQDLDRMKESGYDFGGLVNSNVNGGEDLFTVSYTEFISPLIKAVQELSTEVTLLKELIEN